MTINQRSLIVDGVDLSTLGFVLRAGGLTGWRDGYGQRHEIVPTPNKITQHVITRVAQSGPRSLELEGAIEAGDMATLILRRNRVLFLLGAARERATTLDVRFADDDTRVCKARLDGEPEVTTVRPELADRDPVVDLITIPLVCEDPRIYDATQQALAFGGVATAVEVASAPVSPVAEVDVGTFTLRVRDSAGVEKGFLTVSGAPNPPITVDMDAESIVDSNGDGQIQALADDGGDFFLIDPHWGDPYASPAEYPTIETTAGNGTLRYQIAFAG